MKHLSIDLETYSDEDIASVGLYKYTDSVKFKILLFAYKVDNEAVQIVDLANNEEVPEKIMRALEDKDVIKHAWNAAFEVQCLKKSGFRTYTEQWEDSMYYSQYLGYPASLDRAGKALDLKEEDRKMAEGKRLINKFSKPSRTGKRVLQEDEKEDWELFKEYCKQDVQTEYNILKKLEKFEIPASEWRVWRQCTKLNAKGVKINIKLVRNAIKISNQLINEYKAEAERISGVDNLNSAKQIKEYLKENNINVKSTDKESIKVLLKREDLDESVRKVLEIKQKISKSSLKKYDKMLECVCIDGRVGGLLAAYGARTGRFSGRLVQVQNLPRNSIKSLDEAREMVLNNEVELLNIIYDDVLDVLSQLIRTAFEAEREKKFIVSDFSAIEARVLSWLAQERWREEVFKAGGDIYCASASQMFNVKVVKHGENGHLRQKGKIAELALGYGGSVNALAAMGAEKMGLSKTEMDEIVKKWRASNSNIVRFWKEAEDAAVYVIQNKTVKVLKNLIFRYEEDTETKQSFLTIQLPSGRKLYYPQPTLKTEIKNYIKIVNNKEIEDSFETLTIYYKTQKEIAGAGFGYISTYGGKLVENITQAIARDCLVEVLNRIDERMKNVDVVMHIHDEVVAESDSTHSLEELNALMSEPISWAPGLVLAGAGFEGKYYMKD